MRILTIIIISVISFSCTNNNLEQIEKLKLENESLKRKLRVITAESKHNMFKPIVIYDRSKYFVGDTIKAELYLTFQNDSLPIIATLDNASEASGIVFSQESKTNSFTDIAANEGIYKLKATLRRRTQWMEVVYPLESEIKITKANNK